jgi:hypothetical protein
MNLGKINDYMEAIRTTHSLFSINFHSSESTNRAKQRNKMTSNLVCQE